jgi:bifunctional UDP-N-acetylglucosamine pyrophosphorylase / glucosamine-1-phosphate N-acetyltransferase
MSSPLAVVLAAGKGTRMKADRPKVLFEARGRPLIDYVLDTLQQAGISRILVVIGYAADDVRSALAGRAVEFVEQHQQLGTGHAVQMCRDPLHHHDGPVLIVTGDSPLLKEESITLLLEEYRKARPAAILGTLHKTDPGGLGRIVRDDQGHFLAIVEEKDATDEQRRITEVNMSTYVFHAADLVHALDRLQNNNRQQEFYLTDCPGILKAEGREVRALPVLQPCEALSVNTLEELNLLEQEMERLGY